MDTIRVGVIGTGFMGRCHSLAYNAVRATFGDLPRPILDTICDIDEDKALRHCAAFGFERSTSDWRAVVDDPSIEVVSVTTPNSSHCEIAVAALQSGKHVWCEKPMAATLSDAEAMADAARRADAMSLLGYNYVRNPALAHARRLIEAGTIGRVFDFRGTVDEDYLADPDLPWSWRLRQSEAGLGTLGDITCHLVSIALLLVGPVEKVCAVTETVHRRRPVALRPGETEEVDTEDLGHAVVRFRGGITGVLASSRVAHGRKNVIRVEVHGTDGMIAFDQERLNELQLYIAEGPAEIRGFRTILTGPQHPPYGLFCPAPGHQLGFNDLKVIEAAHLLRCILGLEKPFVGFRDGLAIERTVHALARSAREEGWVEVVQPGS